MKRFHQIGLRLGMLMLALVTLPCSASDLAVLRNGFSIRHERRQILGEVTRLFVSLDGSSYVDVPTAQIEHFEAAPAENRAVVRTSIQTPAPDSQLNISTLSRADLSEVVNSASDRYRLDRDLVDSVIHAESGFNVRAVSPKGAQGLMQLMPKTASQLGVPNAFDPEANVDGGTKYLRELLERYNFDLVKALAAYNAGPRRVEQFGGVPPYYETRAYVARIVRDFNRKKVAAKSAASKAQAEHKASKPSPAIKLSKPLNQRAKVTTQSKPASSPQME
jgi:soluble lytic murein transglycosylase-like protein